MFVGRVGGIDYEQITQDYPNIRFPGEYRYEEVPAIVKGFDVGIMPYFDNDFFRHSNPLKFYEFAAAGIRSVSSNMEELNGFSQEIVVICRNEADLWIEHIVDFLARREIPVVAIGKDIARQFLWEEMNAPVISQIERIVLAGNA